MFRGIRLSDHRPEAIVAGCGFAFAAGLLLEWPPLNGPWYWTWPWRDLDPWATALRMLPGFVPLAWALHAMKDESRPPRTRRVLALLTASCVLHQILGILADPRGIRLIRDIVASPLATSYYSDALDIVSSVDFLAGFPEAELRLHSSTHPPGPVLFYRFWIWTLGPEPAAYAGGFSIAALTAAGVPMAHAFAGLWTRDSRTRLLAAALYATLPGLLLIYPEFDQVYPLFSMAIILAWARALEGDPRAAVALGLVLFLAMFFAYNLLTIGAFLALQAGVALGPKEERAKRAVRVAEVSGIALGVWAIALLLLRLSTGFRPWDAFLSALDTQERLAATHGRPWLACVFFDLYDFSLGAGVLAVPLALLYVDRVIRGEGPFDPEARLSLIGLATIGIVDATGLLRAETARVWLFLQPLLALPAALALSRFSWTSTAGVFGLQWLILVLIKSKMHFVNP